MFLGRLLRAVWEFLVWLKWVVVDTLFPDRPAHDGSWSVMAPSLVGTLAQTPGVVVRTITSKVISLKDEDPSTSRPIRRVVKSWSAPPPPLEHPLGPPNGVKKTLVLDLDETLVHSSLREVPDPDMVMRVHINAVACTFFVKKRPFVDEFIEIVTSWFDVVVFTASLRPYADPVIDRLDRRNAIQRRYFRGSCVERHGNYMKDLKITRPDGDLAQIVIIDNSPIAYALNNENAIPIPSWFDDPKDECLKDLIPFLSALRFTSDVRSVLDLRKNTSPR